MAPRRVTRNRAIEKKNQVIQSRQNRVTKKKKSKRAKNAPYKKNPNESSRARKDRPEKKRLSERKRIERIRADPEVHASYLEAQRKRYQKRKREGKIKLMSQLDSRSQ